MIVVNGVALAYGGCRILEEVSLTIRPGELLALVGPNGAGKTTLLRALAGQREIDAGSIAVDGIAIAAMPARERGRIAALVEAEGTQPDGMTVGDIVALGRLPFRPWWQWNTSDADRAAAARALDRLGLSGMAERPFAQLSSGERQRVWIALAVAQDARMLLLDEPTSHLDIRHAFDALSLVRTLVADGHGAVVVLHDLNLAASFADRIALLGARRLLAWGPPGEVLVESRLSEAYGIPIAVRHEPDGRVVTFATPRAVPGR
jgi:iron complex transport system ATP-binding protein